MTGSRPLRIVVLSSLYPNSQQPRHGVFVEERLRCLVASGQVQARVVAPVPWFGSTNPRFGHYAKLAAVPRQALRYGIEVVHPRYLVVPKIGMTISPTTMARAAIGALERLRSEGFDFDLIDAHYFYPDGVAAFKVAQYFEKPFVVTARGADLNTIADMRFPGRQIRAAAAAASGLVTVSRSLADKLASLGVDPERIDTLRNGVDLDRFAPMDRDAARQSLDVSGAVWLCVGHLIERKGVHIALDGLALVPQATLLIVGDGPLEAELQAHAARLGVTQRVRFLGAVAHDDLPLYYNAADALVLAARSEGMPNVVLEAIACGTAVLATAVDGIPEVIAGLPAGVLLKRRDGNALAQAWRSLTPKDMNEAGRAERRRYAETFGWQPTTDGLISLFQKILHRPATDTPATMPNAGTGG